MDKIKLTKTALATVLGISRQAVHRYEKQGMPCDSIAAAQTWRTNWVRTRMAEPRPPSPTALIRHAHDMQKAGALLLSQGMRIAFDAMVPAIRDALRAVPRGHRRRVLVSVPVMDILVAPILSIVEQEGERMRAEDQAAYPQLAQNTPEEEEENGLLLLYECAAGEWIVNEGDVQHVP